MTLTQINEAIDALELALATGTETVRFGDRTRTYRSVTEIKEALAYFKRRRDEASGNNKNQRFSVVRFNA